MRSRCLRRAAGARAACRRYRAAWKTKPNRQKPARMNGRGEVTSISLEEFFLLQQSGKAPDLRCAAQHSSTRLGHIPGAISLPKNDCDDAHQQRASRKSKPPSPRAKPSSSIAPSLTCPDARTVAAHIFRLRLPRSRLRPAAGTPGRKPACPPNNPPTPTDIHVLILQRHRRCQSQRLFRRQASSPTPCISPMAPRKPSA